MKPHAFLFVDGSSAYGDDIGGWAALAATVTQRKLLYGVAYPTTISRCELVPIIEGLRWIDKNWRHGPGFRVTVYSDSEYTVKTLCGLYARNKNKDLWAGVDIVASRLVVTYKWRERNVLPYMKLCDAVCGVLRKNTIELMKLYFKDVRNPEAIIPFGELPEDSEDANLSKGE